MRFFISKIFLLLFVATISVVEYANALKFDIVSQQNKASIIYAKDDGKLDSIAANLLADDIKNVTGYRPNVYDDITKAKGNVIIIGTVKSKIIASLLNGTITKTLQQKWECYELKTLSNPYKNITSALIIAGSDSRGTAYGVFDVSEKIGVSPWYWWADVNPVKKQQLSLNIDDYISQPPSVKFRGIFINDEDWGLQPWAAKTLEPETKDIGPKTYAKVFELLLRLKANLIWPAMHPSTKAFFSYADNIKVAEDYQIVVGSSHAEPMLRNNVGEWNEKTMGAFNYITNKQKVDDYWEKRIIESKNIDAIYSVGMRGVHDSGIEGVKTLEETVPLVEQIFENQRAMLRKHVNEDITKVPQAFTAYKEVLDVYNAGLKVPADITFVWPDDNYGYIQRLDDDAEKQRPGGSGVYYHLSYWGRPHDYLWLSTTSPGLVREEMTKAYDMDARNIWVVNVGDIKPAEYNIQFFLDMAYRIEPFKNDNYLKTHLKNWVANIFGEKPSTNITNILQSYYKLGFERKPEFMAWSQTEPTTKVNFTPYSHTNYGDQAQKRIDAYTNIEDQAKALRKEMDPQNQSAFYQLVYYPVVGASLMNKKILYRDKAFLYAAQGRISAQHYATLSTQAYEQILKETNYYNTELSNGKWANIMSMKPRALPVFDSPAVNITLKPNNDIWHVKPEAQDSLSNDNAALSLPTFTQSIEQQYFIDLFLCKDTAISLSIKASTPWIHISKTALKLSKDGNQSEGRIWVNIDWDKLPNKDRSEGQIIISSNNKTSNISVNAIQSNLNGYHGFIEKNGYVSIYAKNYQRKNAVGTKQWSEIQGLGATETSLEALPLAFKPDFDNARIASDIKKMPSVSYDFFTITERSAEIKVFTLPTYPLNRNFEMRYAVSVDNGPATIVNFKTMGRSNEWKSNVLSNTAEKSVKVPPLSAGKHTLQIYMIDPGVILDRILIDLGGLKPFYGSIPETRNN